jgi:hypothetical protein
MLGITTMKLFQAWMANPVPADPALHALQRELLVVGMSATALESEQEEAFGYGMHFFCPKPVSLDLLGIILDAKRAGDNEQAIEQICEVTGTHLLEKEEEERRLAVEQQIKLQQEEGMVEGVKNQWNIFRSHKQRMKVAPETPDK